MTVKSVRYALAALLLAPIFFAAQTLNAHEDDEDSAAHSEDLSAAQQEVVDILDRYVAAMEAADFDSIEALAFSDDTFSSFEGSHLDVGWTAYRDHVAPEMALFEDTQYKFSNIRPVVVGEAAYATVNYEMDVVVVSEQFESGRHPIHMSGVGTIILAQHDGAWKIRHLHMARDKGEVKEE